MTRTLVLLAHPDLDTSRVNTALAAGIRDLPDVTVHDLYAAYPDLNIDVAREQRLLMEHDRVVLQFPFYWYSAPPLLKKWLDEVFEHGWAYGSKGKALHGKSLRIATTVGGGEALYRPGGLNRFPVTDLLRPFDATANLTGMDYEEPFIVHGASSFGDGELADHVRSYRELLLDRVLQPAA
ncbi:MULTISPECIES: NAD(P)H-dependent oxidoreductase [Actinomadura]|uniref:Oxidoreductase n=1 Tax=Actinomadura litoris TaxID=2678616 RepID=A0A7K1L0B3_9ACTN|nr:MULTISPECIES: NAD(P)H-dependent oxidoreductase [Actinomadura]MBT2207042.1 NAD(P)H-dependent oxidoreductase [Actinomadura sp. NEAU-AAG7]MUN37878.1 oxidoreductase [Actinomadura litoris]